MEFPSKILPLIVSKSVQSSITQLIDDFQNYTTLLGRLFSITQNRCGPSIDPICLCWVVDIIPFSKGICSRSDDKDHPLVR